jgi:DNA-binding IclR family transcriptional regulator
MSNDRKFVTALARGLEVLRAFRINDGFLGNQEIAERTGLPRPTVTRLTYTLCELGYLTRLPRLGKYQLAPTVMTLGYSALGNLPIRQVARTYMDEAANTLGAPVAMGMADRNRALYLDMSRGSSAYTIQLDIGARIPIAKTAMGWALMAAMAPDDRVALFARLAVRHGEEWPRFRRNIESAMEEYSERGYVSSVGSWRSDTNSVGVPLVAADGSGIYAFNCGGQPHQFTQDKMHEVYGPALRKMVRKIQITLDGI